MLGLFILYGAVFVISIVAIILDSVLPLNTRYLSVNGNLAAKNLRVSSFLNGGGSVRGSSHVVADQYLMTGQMANWIQMRNDLNKIYPGEKSNTLALGAPTLNGLSMGAYWTGYDSKKDKLVSGQTFICAKTCDQQVNDKLALH